MPDRRALLRWAGGAAASLPAAGLAGCALPGTGSEAAPTPPAYADRLHRPAVDEYVAGVGETQRFTTRFARPAAIAERTADLLAAAGDRWTSAGFVERALADLTVDALDDTSVDRWIRMAESAPAGDGRASLSVGAALAGSYDPDAVRERTLAGSDPGGGEPAPAGRYRGYDLVEWPFRERAAAFGAGQVVRTSGSLPTGSRRRRSLLALLEPALDVLAGTATPAADVDRTLARLLGHLGEGFAVRARTPPGTRFAAQEGLVGWGAASVAVEGLRQRWVGVFADRPPVDAVERRLGSGYFIELDSVERRGRAVVATGRVDLPVWLP